MKVVYDDGIGNQIKSTIPYDLITAFSSFV
jgi:hypothetical protein